MKKELTANFIITIIFALLAFAVQYYGGHGYYNYTTLILAAVCVLSALFTFIKAGFSTVNYYSPNGLREAHSSKGFGKAIAVLIGSILLLTALYGPAYDLYNAYYIGDAPKPAPLTLVNMAFMALTGLIYLVLLISGRRKPGVGDGPGMKLCALILALAPCFHLIVIYRSNSSNPNIESFAWEILAMSAIAVKWVYMLGCCAGKRVGSVKKIIFFCNVSTVLCAIASNGVESNPYKAIYLFGLISGILTQILFLHNLNELDIYRDEPEELEPEDIEDIEDILTEVKLMTVEAEIIEITESEPIDEPAPNTGITESEPLEESAPDTGITEPEPIDESTPDVEITEPEPLDEPAPDTGITEPEPPEETLEPAEEAENEAAEEVD